MTSTPTRVLATLVVFWVACGDFVRYLVGYPAWGVLTVAIMAWMIVVLVRERLRLLGLGWPLLLFLGFATLSTQWSVSAGGTLLGLALQAACVLGGLVLAAVPPRVALDALHRGLQIVLGASLLFELFVSVVLRHPIYPNFTDYEGDVPASYQWSRELLFTGDRIQGITGNSNLLGMVALLALIVAVCRAFAGLDRRSWPLWVGLSLLLLGLTRSATVTVALVGVAAVAAVLSLAYTIGSRHRRLVLGIGAGVAVAGIAAALLARDTIFAALGRSSDLTGRFGIWERAFSFGAERPIGGQGFIGYWQPWIPPYDELGIYDGVVYLMAHNVWIDVFMQLGVIGVLLWLLLQVRAFTGAAAWLRSGETPLSLRILPLLLLTAELLQGLAESRPLYELGFILLVVALTGLGRRERLIPSATRPVVPA